MGFIVNDDPQKLNEFSFEERQREIDLEFQEENEENQKAKKSPFQSFYQINKEHSKDLMWLVGENPTAYRILLFLFDNMDKYNAVVCSYQVLQDYFGIGRTTASNAIKLLKEKNFIFVYKSGTSNVYVANPDLVWNSWGKNTAYCKFPANILLSIKEQDFTQIRKDRTPSIQIKVKG